MHVEGEAAVFVFEFEALFGETVKVQALQSGGESSNQFVHVMGYIATGAGEVTRELGLTHHR